MQTRMHYFIPNACLSYSETIVNLNLANQFSYNIHFVMGTGKFSEIHREVLPLSV